MTTNTPCVSILVPIYNVEKYLDQCLDSIVNQTLKNIEIICINDGSTDGSLKIIQKYADNDSRIRIIDKKNSGYGHSMNLGIEAATGEYVGIVESDDYAEFDMFETLYNLAKKDDLDIARSNFYYYTSKTDTHIKSNLSVVPHNKVYAPANELSVFYQQPSIWASIYRTSFIKENEIKFLETPGASYQDTAFSFKVYSLAKRFEIIDKPFIHYRIDGGSSSFQNNTKVYCVCDEYEEIKRFIKEKGLYEKYRYLVPHLQYNGYKWNYNRLTEPYNTQFMSRWHTEFKEEYGLGNISEKVFNDEEYKNAMEIINFGNITKLPKISVIVPVYNVESYLRKCLDSIVNQTLRELEIICVNDGSTDRSLEILQEYATKDTRIKIVDKANGGSSSARNAGLDIATGMYISFVDSDDWIEKETYELALKNIENADIVIFGTNVVGTAMMDRRAADEEYYSLKYKGLLDLTDEIRQETHVSAWNKLYRKSIIDEYGLRFPLGMLYEDYSFYWRYILIAKTVYFEPTKLYNYLRREGSIMQETFSKEGSPRAIEHLLIFKEICDFIQDHNLMADHRETINPIFLNCFWFAYLNVPLDMKRNVLKTGSKYVVKLDLSGDEVIENLKLKRYDLLDPTQSATIKMRILRYGFKLIKRLFNSDLQTFESLFNRYVPPAYDCSMTAATTRWVNDHENMFGIKRWISIYDCSSADPKLNWGYMDGIFGGQEYMFDAIKDSMHMGCEYRVLITLWGAEVAVLQGVILSDERSIAGTSIFDGVNAYAISMDIIPWEGKIRVYGQDILHNLDYSTNCRILRIEKVL